MPDSLVGHHCKLIQDLRNAAGNICSRDTPLLIVRKQDNMGKILYLVQETNGTAYYVFADEFTVID